MHPPPSIPPEMMKLPLFAIAAALLVSTAADARAPAAPLRRGGPPSVPSNCSITIAFGSYGAGIDRPTLVRMERMLRVDRRVGGMSRHPWGREGEVTLCLRVPRARNVRALAADLNEMIPRRPRGPVQVHVAARVAS
jgi:hypothetical protein